MLYQNVNKATYSIIIIIINHDAPFPLMVVAVMVVVLINKTRMFTEHGKQKNSNEKIN